MTPGRRQASHREPTVGTLWTIGWRYLLRHPWQTALMVLGIALGVAVVVAVDTANASALEAFRLSVDAVAGRATHQIVGGPQGLDETLYVDLRLRDLEPAMAPVVSELVSSPQLGDQPLQLLGVDPFAEIPFRDYLQSGRGIDVEQLTSLLTEPGAILLSSTLAERHALQPGSVLQLFVGGYERRATVAGLLDPTESVGRRALEGLVLADISTAQEFTDRLGLLDRIDLILADDGVSRELLESLLPSDARIVTAAARAGTVEQMTAAFRVNLTALSLLALVVGMLLIYNTVTFSVVKRRALFGMLRSLGVTPKEVFVLVSGEALVLGLVGTVLGLPLGVALSQGAIRLVSQTITDVFFVLTVRSAGVPALSLLKGAVLGVIATLLSAAPPAWEAASVSPRSALSRSNLEDKAHLAARRAGLAGVGLGVAAAGLLSIPTRSLIISFAGTSAAILSAAVLTPLVTRALMRLVSPWMERWGGLLGRLAPRDVTRSLSRTAVAIAALMVAVSVTIGVSLMIGSFRYTVTAWMEQALQGDVYVQPPSFTATQAPTTPLDPRALQLVEQWPGVVRVDSLRSVEIESDQGPLSGFAIDNPDFAERPFMSAEGTPTQIWQAMLEGQVTVSEALARRIDLPRRGGSITLYTKDGPRQFRVAGIYYDYISSVGTVALSLDSYRQLWEDDALTAVSLRLRPGLDAEVVAQDIRNALPSSLQLVVRPNRVLRAEVLAIFDRTFAITSALQLLATVVAFIGVLSALLSVQLERQRELGILRALGLTARQLWSLIMLETGLMGLVAGLLAIPTGTVLSLILIYIINRRSFGWTLLLSAQFAPFARALLVAVLAALAAGLYPALKIARLTTADALRYE